MALDLKLESASCIVTGGTRGIGRSVVELLLAQGACVLAVGSRAETCENLAANLTCFGSRVQVVQQDMSRDDAGERVVAAAVNAFGVLDVVVNNASAFDFKPAHTITRDDWRDLVELKLLGYWSLSSAAVPHLEISDRAAITNVSGAAGVAASPLLPNVGAVNAAIISMSESLALALAPKSIRVNVVVPGSTATDRFDRRAEIRAADKHVPLDEVRREMTDEIPLGPSSPAELAIAIVTMCAPIMRTMTGATLLVDGGVTLAARRRV
jgi:NAD(P)-dependent dehydrogenase (short-subunit alcohol dehydrogenase family)